MRCTYRDWASLHSKEKSSHIKGSCSKCEVWAHDCDHVCISNRHIAAQRIRHTCRVIKHGSNLAGLVGKHTLSPPRPSLFPRPTALPRCIFKLLVATAIRKSFLNHFLLFILYIFLFLYFFLTKGLNQCGSVDLSICSTCEHVFM